jgi:hypothetical protein
LGPGNLGVTRETGQTAMHVAQRMQTSELFWGQAFLSIKSLFVIPAKAGIYRVIFIPGFPRPRE